MPWLGILKAKGFNKPYQICPAKKLPDMPSAVYLHDQGYA